MKIKNYEVIKTYYQREGLSIYMVTDENGCYYFLRMLDDKENSGISIEKWYELYEHYQLTITNYKYLPRIHSIDSYTDFQVFSVFSFLLGQFIDDQHRLNRDEVEQLLDAVSHLHVKGLVHGRIHPENIWITDDGKIILYGVGEEKILSQESITINDDLQQLIWLLTNYSELETEKIEKLQGVICNDVEDIRKLLTDSISPGLVEKEKKEVQLPIEPVRSKRRTSDEHIPTDSPPKHQSQNEAFLPKRHFYRWLCGGVVATLVLFVAVWSRIQISQHNKVQTYNNLITTANKYMDSGEYDKAIALFTQSLSYKKDISAERNIKLAENLKSIKAIYDDGTKSMNDKKYLEAIGQFSKVTKEDNKLYKDAQKNIEECKRNLLEIVNDAIKNNKLDEANKNLDVILKIDANNEDAKKLKDTLDKAIKYQQNKAASEQQQKQDLEQTDVQNRISIDEAMNIINAKLNIHNNEKYKFSPGSITKINGQDYYSTYLRWQNPYHKGWIMQAEGDSEYVRYIQVTTAKVYKLEKNGVLTLIDGYIDIY